MTNLKQATIKSLRWTAFSTIIIAFSQIFLQIVKARFLTPEDFAYISIIMILIGLLTHLEGQAFNQALIQKERIEINEASSLLFFNIFLSVVLTVLLLIISPYIELFFNLPGLSFYLRIVCIAVLMQGPISFNMANLQKHFYHREIALIGLIKTTVSFLFVLIFLLRGWGLIVIIYSIVLSATLSLFLSTYWIAVNNVYTIKLYFNLKELKSFMRFGAFVFTTQSFSYLSKRLDEVVIAYFLDSDVLGIYYFGKNMIIKGRDLFDKTDSKIIFPLLSKLKNSTEKQMEVYYKVSKLKSRALLPFFVGIVITAPLFVPIIFGNQWLDSVIVMQAIALSYAYKLVIGGSSGYLLYSVNRPDIYLYVQMVSDVLYFAGLLYFINEGIVAVLLLFAFRIIIQSTLCQYIVHRMFSFNILEYFFLHIRTFVYTLGMVFTIAIIQHIFLSQTSFIVLIVSITSGIIVYSLLNWCLDRENAKELLSLIKN